eukprot:865261_1
MLSFVVGIVLCAHHFANTASEQITTQSTLPCGAVVSDWIYQNETHHYLFITNESYDVTINTCFSVIDIVLFVVDQRGNVISDEYCPTGDWCGECANNDNDGENFTIPLVIGAYSIVLQPWSLHQYSRNQYWNVTNHYSWNQYWNVTTGAGAYQLQISCSNISSLVPITTSSPNNTLTYTTYMPNATYSASDFNCTGACRLVCPFCDGEIYCGSEKLGGNYYFSPSGSYDYYYFNASTAHSVLFASCGSIKSLNLTLYDTDLNVLASGTTHSNCFSFGQKLTIVTSKYEYVLQVDIGSMGFYTIDTVCDGGPVDIFHEHPVQCGQIFKDDWNENANHYYYFNFSSNGPVTIDTCASMSDTMLYLYDLNLTLLYESQDSGYCWYLLTPYLVQGMYYLRVHDVGPRMIPSNSQVEINCADVNQTGAYKPLLDIYIDIGRGINSWFDVEVLCEELYGTTLATIVTSDDMDLVSWIVSLVLRRASEYYPSFKRLSAWIGMYRNVGNESKWQWVNGISCNYTSTNDCVNDVKWAIDEPTHSFDHEKKQLGAYLLFEKDHDSNTSTTRTGMYASSFPVFPRSMNKIVGICDAPTSKYIPRNCSTIHKCWKKIAVYNDDYLITDTVMSAEYHEPPIAFWNSSLFVVGLYDIHYTEIATFHNNKSNDEWHYITYNHTETYNLPITSQTFFQHESSFFLYTRSFEEEQDILIHINLNNFKMKSHMIPIKNLLSSLTYVSEFAYERSHARANYCMVSGPNYLYIIIGSLLILRYDINKDTWSTLEFIDMDSAACAITNDYRFIYIFGLYDEDPEIRNFIIKYDTDSFKYDVLAEANLCLYSTAKAVTALDDKIYLHGCYTASWKTLVFDTTTEQFESETIDVDVPIAYTIPYYRSSQMVVFDDNVLLLVHPKDTEYPLLYRDPSEAAYLALYYAVTELISINFTSTINSIFNESIWPSDGFMFEYYVNDFSHFTDTTDNAHDLYFQSQYNTNRLVIQLNITQCICDKISYKCFDCSQHFKLSNYLSVADNHIDELQFSNFSLFGIDTTNILVYPQQLTLMLERCIIHFIGSELTIYESSVDFQFNISSNCYSRANHNFSLDIVSQHANISQTLVLGIVNASYYTCMLCENNELQNCILCLDNGFKVHYDTHNMDEIKFDVYITSNDIDFKVIGLPDALHIQYFKKDALRTIFDRNWLYLCIIPVIIILFVGGWVRMIYNSAFVVGHGLVFIIACSHFDDKTNHHDLKGVPQNVSDLKKLWKDTYKYDVNICNDDTLHCTKRDVLHFIDSHRSKIQQKKYNAVLIHVISHGDSNSFTTSDGKQIEIDFIQHELITASNEVNHFALIKLIFHHGCQGKTSYHTSNVGR